MTDFEKALSWLTKEKQKCEKRYNDSYNTQTRMRNMERILVISDCINALYKNKRLSDYLELEKICEKRYGMNISQLVNRR